MKKLCSLFILLVGFGSANATLIGSNSGGQLLEIDESTGVGVEFANLGGTAVGVAYDAINDVYYARTFSELFTFDLDGNVNSVGASGSFITGLTFNSDFSSLYSVSQSSGEFYAINVSTGAESLIGNTNVSGLLGLSTNSAGVVYAATFSGTIYTIDLTSAVATLVATVDEGLTAIAFDENDNLYGITIGGDVLQSDLLGTPSNIGTVAGFTDIRGLTFTNPVSQVSAPSNLAILLLSIFALRLRLSKRK